jgi:hypothetical protein
LFVGAHVIPFASITRVARIGVLQSYSYTFGVILGAVPLCLLSLILRDGVLPYTHMRMLTPTFGALMIYRAVLGPTFLIKLAHTLYYVCAYSNSVRQQIGEAFLNQKTLNSAYVATIFLALLSLFIGAAAGFIGVLGYLFLFFLLGGSLYGTLTGASHVLPIHPWIYLTVFGETGVMVSILTESSSSSSSSLSSSRDK